MLDIVQAIKESEDPPCLVRDCPYCQICAEKELACYAFRHYASTGEVLPGFWVKVRVPAPARKKKVAAKKVAAKKATPVRHRMRFVDKYIKLFSPTKEHFDYIFPGEGDLPDDDESC